MNADGAPGLCAARRHVAFAVTTLICGLAFAWMVTFGSFDLVAEDSFGSFYDYQAAAWLEGRWDVPEPSLQGESFIVDGKVYGYFGPTPALLRVPLVASGIGFASTTRLWMLLQYLTCLGAAYALFLLAVRWRNPKAEASSWATVVFTATAGMGSTLFFLGSRAYVYHEAILCGAAFALWSVFCALRFLQTPASRGWLGALVCGVLAIHARAPIGLFALLVLGGVATWHLVRELRSGPPKTTGRFWSVGALSIVGVLSFNAVSYLKFGTFEGCPLRYNVQYTTEELAVLDHRNFHLSNLRFSTDTYLRRPIFAISGEFPYIYREYIDRREYPESRMAYRDPVLAIPWSMPALFALAAAGSLLAFAVTPAARVALMIVWAAGLSSALAMLMAVAVTHRYTADFVPFLIAAAAFGLAAIEPLSRRIQIFAAAAVTLFTLAGIAVNLAITLHHQREIVWGVPAEFRDEYQRWRARIDHVTGTRVRPVPQTAQD